MKRKLITSLLLSTLLLSACSSFSTTTSSSGYQPQRYVGESGGMMDSSFAVKSSEVSYSPSPSGSQDVVLSEDRKVIKTGELSLHVTSVRDAMPIITKLVTDAGGNVDSSNVTRGTNSYSGDMLVRVPSDKFDESMTAFKAQAIYVASEYTNAADVTAYYTDLSTRLTNKQAEEAQYLEILKKAETVTDILSVTQYISNVRYEIESLQGQLKSYDDQIDYSSISLYLSEDESVSAVSETWKPLSTFRQALSDWVVLLQEGVNLGIYLAIFGWPLLLLAWGVRVYLRRNRKSVRK